MRGISIDRSATAAMATTAAPVSPNQVDVAQVRRPERGRAIGEQERDERIGAGLADDRERVRRRGRRRPRRAPAGRRARAPPRPAKPRNPTIRTWIRIAVRSALEGGPLARATRSSVTSASPTRPPASTNAGASTIPIGTRRIAPSAASAAAPGRMSDSTGTPAPCAAGSASATTWSAAEEHGGEEHDGDRPDEGIRREARQRDHHPDRDREVPAPADSPLTRRMVRAGRAPVRRDRPPSRLGRREPGEEVGTGARVQHVPRLHPRPARLRDAPAQVRELARVVGVRVDRQEAAHLERASRPLDRQVQPMGRAVHLEHRAGSRRGSVHRVPVEVEVVARADHPARRVGDHVDVRVLDRVQDALGQLGAGLAPRDVERRDDEVERREELVRSSRAGRRPGSPARSRGAAGSPPALVSGGAVPSASSATKRSLSPRISARSSSTRSGVRPRAIASDCVWSVMTW